MVHEPHVVVQIPEGARRASDVVSAIAAHIHEGRFPPGMRLPSVRELHRTLGISKNTAQAAYDELALRGLIETRARRGVFVGAPRAVSVSPRRARPSAAQLVPLPSAAGWPRRDLLPMSTVFVDPDLLPTAKLGECFRSVLARPLRPFYDAQGHPALREAIAKRLIARGIEAAPDHVIVTTGSQQAIDLVARTLACKRVAIEDPVYGHARRAFESFGHDVLPLRLDPFERVDIGAWGRAIEEHRSRLLYVITSYQNPTGHSYDAAQIMELLELSRSLGVALLEGDWGSDMLPGSEYRPTLRAIGGERVLYANSFTKKLLPSLRIGFLVADESTTPTLVMAKRISTLGNAHILEEVLAEFLERGYYDNHLERLQRALECRRKACIEALEGMMPEGVRWTTPSGGPTLWLDIPRTIDLGNLRARLERTGVHIEDSRDQFAGTPHLHGFRIGFAYLPEERLRVGIERIAEALRRPNGR